jgi:hypothetical protein
MISAMIIPAALAELTTDKPDYAPDEPVNINGTGFLANQTVTLTLKGPEGFTDYVWDTTSDENGNIQTNYTAGLIEGGFTLEASDGTTPTQTTTFTDTPVKVGSVVVDPYDPLSVIQGATVDFTVTVSRGQSGAFTAALSVVDDSPTIASSAISFDPASLTFIPSDNSKVSTLTIDTSYLDPGTYTFKVYAENAGNSGDNAESGTVTLVVEALGVSKDVETSWTQTYDWSIDKSADLSTLTLAVGDTYDVHYTITVDAEAVDTYEVWGEITIYNPSDTAVEISASSITDTIDPDGEAFSATIDPSGSIFWPVTLDGDSSLVVEYYAELSGWDGDSTTNVASVTVYDSVTFDSDAETVAFSSVPDYLVHASIEVTDSYAGGPQDVTVDYEDLPIMPASFTYTRTIGPYSSLELGINYVVNTASFVATDDSETTGSKSWTVTVTVIESTSIVGVTSGGFKEIETPFKLIFTPDMPANPGLFRLTASNPGQFRFNVYHMVEGGEVFTIEIPYPFVTQGANPIQIYDEAPDGYNPQGSLINLAEYGITIDGSPIFLSDYSGTFGTYVTITITNGDYEGPMYITIHLDYGLKKVATGYTKQSLTEFNAINSADGYDDIDDGQEYTFALSGTFGDSDTVTSTNVFKNDPGIGGLVLDVTGTPVPNVKVQITSKDFKATVYTDEEGWYMCAFKYTGKPTSVTITAEDYGEQTITIRSNNFDLINFDLSAAAENTGSTVQEPPTSPALPPGKGKK